MQIFILFLIQNAILANTTTVHNIYLHNITWWNKKIDTVGDYVEKWKLGPHYTVH